jgi:uncharacterized membrane protein YciS (DUF1049 family)
MDIRGIQSIDYAIIKDAVCIFELLLVHVLFFCLFILSISIEITNTNEQVLSLPYVYSPKQCEFTTLLEIQPIILLEYLFLVLSLIYVIHFHQHLVLKTYILFLATQSKRFDFRSLKVSLQTL